LQVSLPNEPLYVDGDAARLMQVVSNIVNNAVKYTPRGGEISIGLARFGDQAVLRVRDNGPGIPPDMLQAIFEPFRQVDETIVRARGGLGLGLMLAKELVQLHGGTIEARSEGLGRGSEFIVSLPVMVDVAVRRSAERDLSPSADAAASQGRSILVVDDLLDSAKTLGRLLRSLGHDAAAVDGGAAAIEWLHEHHPDVIFLDVAMPELDGYETARRLRARPELDDVVLVALTGYGQPSARRRTFEAGFDFHLTKPVSLPVLEDLLQKLPRRTERAAVPL
jgi:CheY-like chemotaxis protein